MKNNQFRYNLITINVITILLLHTIGYSQPVTWVKIIGDSVKSMGGVSVVQTFDGGYAILGYKGIISNDEKMLLVKLDYLGNLQWLKYPADTIINISPLKLVQTRDSGFVMLCSEYQVGDFLLKTDKDGNFLWRKNYPDTAVEASLYGFTKTLDNGFILCGNYYSYNPPSDKGYLIKTDSLGNVKWQRGYMDSTVNNYGDIIQFPDSNFYIAGYTYNTANKCILLQRNFLISVILFGQKYFLSIPEQEC